MNNLDDEQRVVSASRVIKAPADTIFDLIADPARQIEWDANGNLDFSAPGQRVHQVGDVFVTTTTKGADRANHIVEFEEGRRVAWKPGAVGEAPAGHLWRWELEPTPEGHTKVTHTYDWTDLHDERRIPKARATKSEYLGRSLDKLAETAELLALGRMGI